MKRSRITAMFLAGAIAVSGAALIPGEYSPLMTGVSAAETAKLPAPGNFVIKVSAESAKLNWDAVDGAYAYRIWYYDPDTEKYAVYDTVKYPGCEIVGLAGETTYKFRVAAVVKKNGKLAVQTKSKVIKIKTKKADPADIYTSDKAPSHMDSDFMEKAGGKGHKEVLKKCGIGNYTYNADYRNAVGTVQYAGQDCELTLTFNEKDELSSFLLMIPSEKKPFEAFAESLVSEGYEKYYNDILDTDIYQIIDGDITLAYFYDDESGCTVMTLVYLNYYTP